MQRYCCNGMHVTVAAIDQGVVRAPCKCLRLAMVSAALRLNSRAHAKCHETKNTVAVHRSSTESNVQPCRFVAPRRRAIWADFAARGRTEISLQRATLDSASAARSRCIIRPWRRPATHPPPPSQRSLMTNIITPSTNKFKKIQRGRGTRPQPKTDLMQKER